MKILISNDDGYLAPGINALADRRSPISSSLLRTAIAQDHRTP
jgi:broad specificity polyphosphatase/5'/3'-nucleotidase SurE